jgi:hypothetical protein
MLKFTDILHESSASEEVQKNLASINQLLGNPDSSTFKINEGEGYVFRWRSDFFLDEYNGIREINKLSEVFNSVKKLQESQIILDKFDMDFKIEDKLYIRFTPKSINPDSEEDDY